MTRRGRRGGARAAVPVLLGLALAGAAPWSHAASAPAPSPPPAPGSPPAGPAADRLSALQAEVRRLTDDRARLAAEERSVIGRLDALAAEARLQQAKAEALAAEHEEAERALAALDARAERLAAQVEAGKAQLRETMLLLQQAGPLGRVRPLLVARGAAETAGALRLSVDLTVRRRDELDALRAAIVQTDRLRDERRAAAGQLEVLAAQAREAQQALEASIRDRRAALGAVREQGALRERAVAELERAGRDLADMLATGGGGRPPALDVRTFRGLLPMPAEGTVAIPFGDRRDARLAVVMAHPGWDIAARPGAGVRSVFEGRVAWAAWFRGYGLMVVVDHGHGVHTVYGHLSAIGVAKGDEVQRGQSLGLVGDTGPLGEPSLYFELRSGGKAEDPARWIDARGR